LNDILIIAEKLSNKSIWPQFLTLYNEKKYN